MKNTEKTVALEKLFELASEKVQLCVEDSFNDRHWIPLDIRKVITADKKVVYQFDTDENEDWEEGDAYNIEDVNIIISLDEYLKLTEKNTPKPTKK